MASFKRACWKSADIQTIKTAHARVNFYFGTDP